MILTTNDIILDRLRKGPALSSELAALIGATRDELDADRLDLGGAECTYNREIVEAAVRRMNEHGYLIANMRAIGGRNIAMYRLIAEPNSVRTCCVDGCRTRLRRTNRTAYCSIHAQNEVVDDVLDAIIAGLEADLARTCSEVTR